MVSAQPQIILQHEEVQPQEIILGEIPASNFLTTLESSDLKFYQDNKQVFFEHELFFYNNTYYFYALINKAGNYTIKISNIIYQDPSPKSITLEKQFFSKESRDENNQTHILSINPGVIFTSKPANITLSNRGILALDVEYGWYTEDKEDSGFFPFFSPDTISPGNFKRILITPEKSFEYFEISSYKNFKIPVIYLSIFPLIQADLRAQPDSIQIKINEDNATSQKIELFNFGNSNITSVAISSNISIMNIESQISAIPLKTKTNFTIFIIPESPGVFAGNITINYTASEKYSLKIPVEIFVFSKNVIIEKLKTCAELGGVFCIQNQTCSESVESYDSPECCIGKCEEKKSGTDYSWLTGLGLLIAVLLILYLVYKKLKKTKPKSPEEKIQERTKLYEQRVSGSLTKE